MLVRPLPYSNPEELVLVYDVQPACDTCPASFTKLDDWRRNSTSFSVMAGSSGQQVVVTGLGDPERVAIARTLAARPKLVLADEPTGNLDEATADAVFALMCELVRDSGAALVLVTHSGRLAARLDRRLHLSGGLLS